MQKRNLKINSVNPTPNMFVGHSDMSNYEMMGNSMESMLLPKGFPTPKRLRKFV